MVCFVERSSQYIEPSGQSSPKDIGGKMGGFSQDIDAFLGRMEGALCLPVVLKSTTQGHQFHAQFRQEFFRVLRREFLVGLHGCLLRGECLGGLSQGFEALGFVLEEFGEGGQGSLGVGLGESLLLRNGAFDGLE